MLPQVLREALFSEFIADTAEKIYADHHIDDVKAEKINKICALVLMGFLHPEEISQEIKEELDLPKEVTDPLADDLNKKVFSQYAADIKNVYDPAVRTSGAASADIIGTPAAKTISLEDIGTTKEEVIPVETSSVTLKQKDQAADSPFIIHEENVPEGNVTSQKSVFRSVTAPLGGFFFKKRVAGGETKPAIAKLEIPGLKPEGRRVVHYSETRTPVGELEEPSFLNVGEVKPLENEFPALSPEVPAPAIQSVGSDNKPAVTIKPKAEATSDKLFEAPVKPMVAAPAIKPVADTAPSQPAPNSPAILGAIKKPEPRVEGNTIDLKGE